MQVKSEERPWKLESKSRQGANPPQGWSGTRKYRRPVSERKGRSGQSDLGGMDESPPSNPPVEEEERHPP